nr:biotin-dependent carboxyltransferase family protein [Neoroseomonas soli]
MTTVQDRGRFGYLRYGVTEAGPMDRQAFAIAQAALGNPLNAAAIETTIGGVALRCIEGEVTVASAGGGFHCAVDGRPVGAWGVFSIREGSVLTVRPGYWGSWTYLAFAGDIVAPAWLGSRATNVLSDFGGLRLQAGQHLEIRDAERRPGRERDLVLPVTSRPRQEVRVVLGPQDRFFAPETIRRLLSETFTLSNEYDRMGVRLQGPKLPIVGTLDMPSEALPRGSVQVPGHGDPIVLMADHQTTGGYPKIAVLASADQDGFAQLRSRDRVTFRAVTASQAASSARTRAGALRQYLQALGVREQRSAVH